MKLSLITKLSGAALAVSLSFSASAVALSTVGSVDNLLGSSLLANSSLDSENAFIQGILGTDYTLTGKYDSLTAGDWEAVEGDPEGYGLDFSTLGCTEGTCSTEPAYYVIKLGTGGSPGADDTYLFQNLASLEWAYVQLSQFGDVSNMNIGRVSHISVGDGGGDVPEPASLALLGMGLLGAGAARRLRKQKA